MTYPRHNCRDLIGIHKTLMDIPVSAKHRPTMEKALERLQGAIAKRVDVVGGDEGQPVEVTAC